MYLAIIIFRQEFLILFFMIGGPPGLAMKFLLFSADLRQCSNKKIREISLKLL